MSATTHLAGPSIQGLQLCARCGVVLSDYRNSAWAGDGPPPKGWAEGVGVEVDGPFMQRVPFERRETTPACVQALSPTSFVQPAGVA